MDVTVLPAPWACVRRAIVFPSARSRASASSASSWWGLSSSTSRAAWEESHRTRAIREFAQEKCELLLDLLGLVGNLPVGPAKDAPPLVDQTVLFEKVILVFGNLAGIRDVPRQTVDFEGDALIEGPQRKVNESAPTVNVLYRILRREKADVLNPEDLGKELCEEILGGGAGRESRTTFAHKITQHNLSEVTGCGHHYFKLDHSAHFTMPETKS